MRARKSCWWLSQSLGTSYSTSRPVDNIATLSYITDINTVVTTAGFDRWLTALRDGKGRKAVARRIVRLEGGNAGDSRSVGDLVTEMRVDTGPGYRVYFTRKEQTICILLCGGDKSSQESDISRAQSMAAELHDQGE